MFISRNNFSDLSSLSPLVNLYLFEIEYNGIDHIDFTHLSHSNNLDELFVELNPKQSITVAEITKSLPSLKRQHIVSTGLSDENQKHILNDSKQKLDIYINGKEYLFNRHYINQKETPHKMFKCLGIKKDLKNCIFIQS